MKDYFFGIQTFTTILAACLSAGALSCSSVPKLPPDLVANETHPELETVVILGLNDIHGALAPQKHKSKENPGVEPVTYETGGAAILATQIKQLRGDFRANLIVLDAGDELQGSIESNLESGAPMIQFFNAIGLNAATIGNHEFDFGADAAHGPADLLGTLKSRMAEAKYPYVVSNVVEKTTSELPPFPNTRTHLILQTGRSKVGIIGLVTPTTPVVTRPENVRSLKFTDLREATLREAAALRKEGANIIVLLGHLAAVCEPGKASTTHVFRKPTDPSGDCHDEVADLIDSLPAGTIDAAVSGHSHTMVYHWVDGVPVIQGGTRANYFNLIYLTYDWNQHRILTDRSRIEGPVPVCPKIFENQHDCNGNRAAPPQGRGPLVTPTLHGRKVKPDSEITDLLAPVFARSDTEKKKVIGQAARPLEHNKTREAALGNLIADSVRGAVKADMALVNPGGIRSSIDAGPITYEDLFRAVPFDNAISVLTVSGKELKDILRVAESGSRGWFPVSGLQLRVIDLAYDAPSNDLNGDHKIMPWEINRLLDVRLSDGSPIRDRDFYKLATIDFLVQGGDDMGWAMSRVPKERVVIAAGGYIRDAVAEHIAALTARYGTLNTNDHPLVDAAHPRIKAEAVSKKTGGKRHHKKHRRH